LQFGVGVDALDGHLRLAAVGRGDAQVVQREFERPGFEIDLADGYLAAELFARDLLKLALGDRRHGQPGNDPERQQNQQRDDPTPHPFVLFDRSYVHRGSVPQRRVHIQTQESPERRAPAPRHAKRKPGGSTECRHRA
jgi:hypothetical protein